jgi:hypothetical protein
MNQVGQLNGHSSNSLAGVSTADGQLSLPLNGQIKGRQPKCLKVPKREIFVTELFTLSDPIWIGDLRTEPRNLFV